MALGLTKQYLRYASSALFGVVASNKGNISFVEQRGIKGKYVAVPACEHVFIWDVKKAEKILVLQGGKHEVTALTKSCHGNTLAVGYADGSISLFNVVTGEMTVSFNGHKSAVTALNFDKQSLRLVSGSKDTDVIVWDVVNESGLFRLKGHKGVITQCVFMTEHNILITSSKDTFVKFWDLDTQHCFKTLLSHRTEVWDIVLCNDDKRLITGSADSELRVWDITYKDQAGETDGDKADDDESPAKKPKLQDDIIIGESDEDEEEEDSSILSCTKVGSVMRQGRERVVSMAIDATGQFLGCHGPDSSLELFALNTEEEAKKRLQKRQKRARKKQRDKEGDEEGNSGELTLELGDQIRSLCQIKAASKIRSFDILVESTTTSAKVVLLLHNNTVEGYSLNPEEKKPEPQSFANVCLPSHRSDVRTLCFSSDNTTVLSGSGDSVKIWNRSTQHCIRTMKSGYALCSAFVTGERHCIVGTKTGKLELFDIASGTMLESIDAHDDAVWSIAITPNKKGFVTGSADKTLKFWNFELVSDEDQTSKRLTVELTRTLQMSDSVLCVKFSPDHKLIAASLLDSTIKVFFADTLKFFLSLYGHKLPVLTLDISSDSTLLISGSADRNIKLWGLDFGDCHKSIFAHDDSIMCVQFVPDTHMFFTGGKDKKIKQWDGDNFELVQTLEGHHGEVWSLAISPNGDYIVSSSHDKSLRLWERTEEPLVLQEEREMEREKEFEESIGQGGEQTVIPGEAASTETGMAGKKTIETVKAAERLMEALELYKEEAAKLKEHEIQCKVQKKQLPAPKMHPILQAFGNVTPKKYFLQVLMKVKSSELEESLLVLPFSYIIDLLPLLENYISLGWEVERCCRCLFFLLRIHHGQITSNQLLLPVIERLRHSTIQKVSQLRDTVGFNMAGLQFMQRELEAQKEVQFFADATGRYKEKKKKRKKAETVQSRAVLAIST